MACRVSGLIGPWDLDRAATALAVSGSSMFRCAHVAEPDYPGLKVFVHRPARFGRDSPILIVMHGTKRNALDYRTTWAPIAERHGCLLVCPAFPKRRFPRQLYQLGGVVDRDGLSQPRTSWTFSAIERMFDLVRDATANTSMGYHLYGHSAGGQFVHRLTLCLPDARFVAAVAANTGWYTMPSWSAAFPYGLAEVGITSEHLAHALQRRLIVLLGERDLRADDPYLRNSSRARQQGANRFERGCAFYAAAIRAAANCGLPLAWEVATVPGAAHVDAEMAPAAARALFSR